ncbi:hypothetical protein KKF29_00370, partial [Patescibacteria group bacterium]|nr:hypothetical protein [Patescibacteria group bacterium]
TLRKENILPQDRLPVPELLSQRLADMGWPLELQGTGKTDYKNREFSIRYPLGDVFFSFATTIHETGHWRQSEIDKDLSKRSEFLPEDEINDIPANEEDAYRRGWERTKKYAPELVTDLETKFAEFKKAGKLKAFDNFEQLYEWFVNFGLAISRAIDSIEDTDNKAKRENQMFEALKQAGMETKFKEFAELRVGELVDSEQMERYLMKMADGVAIE